MFLTHCWTSFCKRGISEFLANVRYMLSSVRLSVFCLSVCLSVFNVRAPYSRDWNFRQCFYAIWYLGHPLTYR